MGALPGADRFYNSRDEGIRHVKHPQRRAYAAAIVKELATESVFLKRGAVVGKTWALNGSSTGTQRFVDDCHSDHVTCAFNGVAVRVVCAPFDANDNRNDRLGT